MIIKKNATIHIKARIFYGDYLYGFIISLILSIILVFLFMWTQGSYDLKNYILNTIGLSLIGTYISASVPI